METQKEILLKENFKLKELKMGCGGMIHHCPNTRFAGEWECDSDSLCDDCEQDVARQKGRIEGIKFMFRKIKSSERKKGEKRTGGRRSAS